MSVYENVRFAQIGYAAVFDRKKECFSTDRSDLMKHLEKQIGVRTAMRINIEKLTSFEHRFSYSKVRYRATFTPFHECFFLCRVYPEDSYMKCAYSGLYKYISDMRMNAAEMICELRKLDEELGSSENGDTFRSHTAGLIAAAEKEYSTASDILRMFDKQHVVEYIPIVMYLDRTNERVRKNNSILRKNVILDISIRQSVARVNYMLFEGAITCLVKLFYKIMQKGESITLKITGTDSGSVSLKADCAVSAPVGNTDTDVGLLKCMFDALDGSAVLRMDDGKFIFRGEIPVSLSNYFNRIKGIYAESDESVFAEQNAGSVAAAGGRDRNKPYEFRSHQEKYEEDILDVMWSIAMNSLYQELSA